MRRGCELDGWAVLLVVAFSCQGRLLFYRSLSPWIPMRAPVLEFRAALLAWPVGFVEAEIRVGGAQAVIGSLTSLRLR